MPTVDGKVLGVSLPFAGITDPAGSARSETSPASTISSTRSSGGELALDTPPLPKPVPRSSRASAAQGVRRVRFTRGFSKRCHRKNLKSNSVSSSPVAIESLGTHQLDYDRTETGTSSSPSRGVPVRGDQDIFHATADEPTASLDSLNRPKRSAIDSRSNGRTHEVSHRLVRPGFQPDELHQGTKGGRIASIFRVYGRIRLCQDTRVEQEH